MPRFPEPLPGGSPGRATGFTQDLTLDNDDEVLSIRVLPMHYGIKAMGARTLRISELYLSFSPHPNISDGNFNLVHHFFRMQILQINEKGAS